MQRIFCGLLAALLLAGCGGPTSISNEKAAREAGVSNRVKPVSTREMWRNYGLDTNLEERVLVDVPSIDSLQAEPSTNLSSEYEGFADFKAEVQVYAFSDDPEHGRVYAGSSPSIIALTAQLKTPRVFWDHPGPSGYRAYFRFSCTGYSWSPWKYRDVRERQVLISNNPGEAEGMQDPPPKPSSPLKKWVELTPAP